MMIDMDNENNLVKKKDILLEIDEYFKLNPFYGLGNFMVKSVAKGAVDELYYSFMNENETTEISKDLQNALHREQCTLQ